MNKSIDESALLAACRTRLNEDRRSFVAIAGAPGSGKSTLVERLQQALGSAAAILPMDGFHYDDAILLSRGRRAWKGAPDTFDVGGLRSTLARLADPAQGDVAVPVFDRELEVSRGSARIIPRSVQLILVEGNYLLLDEQPWQSLQAMFDITIMIDVAEEELARRLRDRWVHHGLNEAEIVSKLEDNDLPNGRTVREGSVSADFYLIQS